mmetsp:Transcript_52298/g.161051  ORF Transcript_52298/g.161051 Transcript_52298/m.161051 type:complete len:230 (+) Transcript_52298:30-719(+)
MGSPGGRTTVEPIRNGTPAASMVVDAARAPAPGGLDVWCCLQGAAAGASTRVSRVLTGTRGATPKARAGGCRGCRRVSAPVAQECESFSHHTGEEELMALVVLLLQRLDVGLRDRLRRRQLPAALLLERVEDGEEERRLADLVAELAVERHLPVGRVLLVHELGVARAARPQRRRGAGEHGVQLLDGRLADRADHLELRRVEGEVDDEGLGRHGGWCSRFAAAAGGSNQ